MPVPPALSRPYRRPSPPQNPPTDVDLARATHFEMSCTMAFGSGDLDAAQVSAAVLYKQAVINSAAPNMMAAQQAPPPWLAHMLEQALENAIGPLRNDITTMKNDIAVTKNDIAVMKNDIAVTKNDIAVMKNDIAVTKNDVNTLAGRVDRLSTDMTTVKDDIRVIKQRQADAQRCAARAYNRQVQLGDRSPFEEVPWRNGTYPWGFMFHNQPLPELTSTDVVRALDNRQSKKYYSGYYPGVNVPDDRIERNKAILIAIGVPAMVAEIAAGEM
ncbi:hypothetical protein POSPLADRAFT_1074146 [Postia placenta MAD-698-R-SB12]|uniref:Mug135-like C-terminal domain-containing protein n=1 Tax=Postia placenta MAD-698-R-SB12 TaxID=670580 RepID=A0A1X6N5U9_9APHY|nr:hypothetical protein POSPLADRAFT_1074146 [Postia placenta MAD-698-R-SB12]OSX63783.1 hypothetical protein POSPLADRAFT_1074146 [Postia placenta MAD-698-R-SB12]